MSEIKDRPNKRALLQDLEHIRESLSHDDFEDDIPLLTDSLADANHVEDEDDDEELIFDEKRIFDDYEDFEDGPLNIDVNEDDDDMTEESEELILRAAYRETLKSTSSKVLAGQQSLFDAEAEFSLDDFNTTDIRSAIELEQESESSALPHALGENPFLPKHIRERLTQGKNSFLEEIALVNESLKKQPSLRDKKIENQPEIRGPSLYSKAKSAHEKIVDDLIAEYLPQIEAALRKRLLQVIKEKDK